MTHLDLFSGYAGFSLAFTAAGFRTVAFSEIDPFCCRLLAYHFPDIPNLGDVRAINGTDVRRRFGHIDVITFGSPCQDTSVAGKRKGLQHGARSSLYFDAVRIIAECRPTFALWEQPDGVFSSHRGWDFGVATDALADIGALELSWAVLDAQWFGVPQRRRRIFLVANFGAPLGSTEQILFEPARLSGYSPSRREAGEGVAAIVVKGAAIGRQPSAGPQRGEVLDDGSCFTLNTVETHAVVAPSLGSGGNRTGGTRSPGTDVDTVESLIPFDLAQATSPDYRVRLVPRPDAPPLNRSGQAHVAYACQGSNVGEFGQLRRGNAHVTGGLPFVATGLTKRYAKGADSDVTDTLIADIAPPLVARSSRGKAQSNSPGFHADGSLIAYALKANAHGAPWRADGADNLVTHALSSEGADASEDGTGRGTPLVRDPNGTFGDALPAVCTMAFHPKASPSQTLNPSEVSPTLDKSKEPAVIGRFGVRRLMPVECERLQGVPDGWTDIPGASDSARYKALGNGVAVVCPAWIAPRIAAVLQGMDVSEATA